MDTAEQIRHYKNNGNFGPPSAAPPPKRDPPLTHLLQKSGKGRFTVQVKGVVTVCISEKNIQTEKFTYGDPFCLAMKATGEVYSVPFGGRLGESQRTFYYSTKGLRIGTFVKRQVFTRCCETGAQPRLYC